MLLGIDEVGRGCWAGPLVAGAVVLPSGFKVPRRAKWKLADSKVLTKPQREMAADSIKKVALAIGLGWVSSAEVDKLGLTAAVSLAMRRAVEEAITFGHLIDEIIIDGSYNFLPDITGSKAIIKADGSIPSVSAASIMAKVARDNWMAQSAALEFPEYGFERHVGYGTREHQAALQKHGATSLHRQSFKPIALLASIHS